MGAALSLDCRERVIEAWKTGEWTWEELAEQFGIGVATVNRLVARYRRTGSVEPSPRGGGQVHRIPDEKLHIVRELVAEQPDRTLDEFVAAYGVRTGVYVSISTMSRALRRLELTRKKKSSSHESGTGAMSSRRAPGSSRRSPRSSPKGSFSSTKPARTSR